MPRPNLSAVVDGVIELLDEEDLSCPVNVYVNTYADPTDWSVTYWHDDEASSSYLITVGTLTRKLLRNQIKDALDILEGMNNDKRGTRHSQGTGKGKVVRGRASYRLGDDE